MTYRDPNEPTLRPSADPATPYRDPNDPTPRRYADPARAGGWGAGSIIGAIVVLAIIVAAIAYAMNRSSTRTASGPGATQSAPSTTGQGTQGPR